MPMVHDSIMLLDNDGSWYPQLSTIIIVRTSSPYHPRNGLIPNLENLSSTLLRVYNR